MEKRNIKAIDLAKELGLYLKVVVSTRTFDSYNSFYNIYGESEEPCRRIVVLTPYKDLEEVIDEKPSEKIEKYEVHHGNVWLQEYPLTTNPKNINLEDILVKKDKIKINI